MDRSCSDLEFFDFDNATEEEIKEIQAILKGPGSNGCVELPWEGSLKENCLATVPENEAPEGKVDPVVCTKSDKTLGTIVGQALHFTSPQTPLSVPVARLPPVDAFVAPPTTIGPYANSPYFVSRTIPFVRAYPHMGVPIFACPLPGAGETSPMPSPYDQFVPVVPPTPGQEKVTGHVENDSNQKNKGTLNRPYNRHNKKKLSSEYSTSFESEGVDIYREPAISEEQTSVPSVTSTVSSDHPSSLSLVPLPVPPSTFGVAGSTLPLHGYPPGLHTLPYTQMSGPQAPSAAMYYVPVFNHPYGSYIPSPPSAPMVLPVNLRPETNSTDVSENCNEEVLKSADVTVVPPASVSKCEEDKLGDQSNCKVVSEESKDSDVPEDSISLATAKSTVQEIEAVTDCYSIPVKSSKTTNSNPDCIPEKVTIVEDSCKYPPETDVTKNSGRDSPRRWADLFKKPCSEVNGIDRQLHSEQSHDSLKKEVANGKLFSVPANDNIL